MTGTLTLDQADQAAELDLSSAERWHLLVLGEGRPLARVDLARPADEVKGALLAAAFLRWGDRGAARDRLAGQLRHRLGFDGGDRPQPIRCSVIVCTHRRPQDLARLLRAFGDLDPAPVEIIVVDNDPGGADCREEVLNAGYRYVREDRRGLDNARNAGLASAREEFVVFTDDDCVTPPDWLAGLAAAFSNPAVAGVTGPAFPLVLDSRIHRRMEQQGSLARGLRRLAVDWTVFLVPAAGAIGAGANMAFRRKALEALGPQPFPPELDAGTVSESGGDTYVLARLLASGHRLVYDPATFVFHRHREDPASLHRAFFGYGVGLGAALTRLLLRDGELASLRAWSWLISQYGRTQLRRLAGEADAVQTRLSWDYLRGGIIGPLRWRRALAAVPPAPTPTPPTASTGRRQAGMPLVGTAADSPPEISVVLPTHQRPDALDRCLAALAAQDVDPARFEVVVVDDSPQPTPIAADHAGRLRLQVFHTGGVGAAAARNSGAAAAAGRLLLFLDDDVIAETNLIRTHLDRHEEADDLVVVGACPPAPALSTLAASAAALWWHDFFEELRESTSPTFSNVLTGNMSVGKAAFDRSGRFEQRFGRFRREDWEWGVRALESGLRVVHEPGAVGRHEFRLEAAGRLRAAELEAKGDSLFLEENPQAAAAVLPLVGANLGSSAAPAGFFERAWSRSSFRQAVIGVLELLERGRLRLSWVKLFNRSQRASYKRGLRAVAGHGPAPEAALLDLHLDRPDPLPAPSLAAPTIRVRVDGREVTRVQPPMGLWTPDLVEQILDATPAWALERAALATGAFPAREEAHANQTRTLVLFGPRHRPEDSMFRAELEAAGAEVAVLGGERSDHWREIVAAAEGSCAELIALPAPGVRPDARWLQQALVGFEGPYVGAVLGRGISEGAPPEPMVLHSRRDREEDPRLEAVSAPAYLVFRRDLLPVLQVEMQRFGTLGPVLALVDDALDGGWTIGYRDTHGLAGLAPSPYHGAKALNGVRIRRQSDRRAGAWRQSRRIGGQLAWHLLRRRQALKATQASIGGGIGLLLGLPAMGRRK